MRKEKILLQLVIISLFTLPCCAEFQVNTRTTDNQTNAAVACDAEGNFVAVWGSYRQDGDRGGIFARRFAPDGNAIGDEFQVNTITPGHQKVPDVAMNATGRFVVTWQSGDFGAEDVFARLFDANAVPVGLDFQVNTNSSGRQLFPRAAMKADGGFVIVCENNPFWPALVFWEVYYRLYDSNGTAIGVGRADLESDSRYPDVATDDNGNFKVVWMQDDGHEDWNVIMVREFDSNGSAISDVCAVNSTAFDTITQPSIAADRSGNFVVAWDGRRPGAQSDDIFARRYSADGTATGAEFRVNTTVAGAQRRPRVAMNYLRQFMIVWQSENEPGIPVRDIFAQRYDHLNQPIGDEFRINTYVADDQKYADVAIGDNAKFLTVWQSNAQDSSGYGIFAETGLKAAHANPACDGYVGFRHFYTLADQWLQQGIGLTADLIDDNRIDEKDLAAFSQQWLTPCYQCTEADIFTDGKIDWRDYLRLARAWQQQGSSPEDITGNGTVDSTDLKTLLFYWTQTCQ